MPLMLEAGRGHLDVTSGCHRLYLGTHVSNSAEQTGTVWLDLRVTPSKEISRLYRMTGRDRRRSQAAAPVCSTSGGWGNHDQKGDACL
jgi:hypothetical protein